MKSKVIVFSMLLILSLLVSACSSNTSSKDSSLQTENGSKKQNSGEKYTIKLGHSDKAGDDSIIDWTARKFADLAKKYSDGRINVKVYPAAQLGDNLEGMRAVQNGSQEMVQGSVAQFGQFCSSINYLGLPYIFTDEKGARKAIDKLWGKNNDFCTSQAGMRFLVWTDAGFRNLTTDKDHPVRSLADMKGLKMRIAPNPVTEAAFSAFGANTQTLDFSEVFTALQQGVVDGQENANTTAVTEHYYEVQKYVTDIKWQYTLSAMAISQKFFDGLPEDLQKALVKAGKDATLAERKRFDKMNQSDIDTLKKHGMEFLGKPKDYDKWVKLGKGVWPKAYKDIGNGDTEKGKQTVNSVLEILK